MVARGLDRSRTFSWDRSADALRSAYELAASRLGQRAAGHDPGAER